MLKEILRKAVTPFRWLTVAVGVSALSLGGASSAERAIDFCSGADESGARISENAQLIPGPPAPDEIPQNMTPSGKPNCEPYAYFSVLLIGDLANFDSRIEGDCAHSVLRPGVGQHLSNCISVRSTAGEVSSRLGLQFTLVGAKPSGTS